MPYSLPSADEAAALHTKGNSSDLFIGGLPGRAAWEGEVDEVCLTAECIDQVLPPLPSPPLTVVWPLP